MNINRKQQQKAHAQMRDMWLHSKDLMKDIGEHVGYFSEARAREMLKERFTDAMDLNKPFSLKKGECSQIQFKAFYDFLTSLALDLGVNTHYPMDVYQDIERFCAKCIELMQCCVTGDSEDVEIHFVDKPVYNSYYEWDVRKYRRMALRSDKHKEIEEIGLEAFLDKYPTCIPVKCGFSPESRDKYE